MKKPNGCFLTVSALATVLNLTACAAPVPVSGWISTQSQVPGQGLIASPFTGNIRKGITNASLTFRNAASKMHVEKLSCSGPFIHHFLSNDVTVPLSCSKNVKGTAVIIPDTGDIFSGNGQFTLSNGAGGSFLFGTDLHRNGVL